ncbi:MAG: response regulator [Rhizobiales bacterium]|nr:response regulator [Hyphomicrobiales bacterium]
MVERSLRRSRILVAEDEYLLADELRMELTDAGAVVLGPVGTVGRAADLVQRETRIDGAILDVNLGGEMVYPVADLLVGRDTPFVFTTGYDASAIPSRYDHVPRYEKPVSMVELMEALARIMNHGIGLQGRASDRSSDR